MGLPSNLCPSHLFAKLMKKVFLLTPAVPFSLPAHLSPDSDKVNNKTLSSLSSFSLCISLCVVYVERDETLSITIPTVALKNMAFYYKSI